MAQYGLAKLCDAHNQGSSTCRYSMHSVRAPTVRTCFSLHRDPLSHRRTGHTCRAVQCSSASNSASAGTQLMQPQSAQQAEGGARTPCSNPHTNQQGTPAANDFSSSSSSSSNRRELLLHGTLAPFLVQLALGSDDATTIVNSVLSAYGLPTFKASSGFKVYDEFEDEFYFEYPKSWVSRPNSLREGVYISDFQTADKVSVEVLDLPEDGDIATAAVAAAVLPGGKRRMQDDRLGLPAQRLIKSSTAQVDGQEMLYLEFPSETITRSGYNIRRKNFAAAAVKRNKLYTIAASARSDQFNEDKKQMLQRIVQSFRLR